MFFNPRLVLDSVAMSAPVVQVELGRHFHLGDRLTGLSAARAFARTFPEKEVWCNFLPELITLFGDNWVKFGSAGTKLWFFRGEAENSREMSMNWAGMALASVGIVPEPSSRMELPQVGPHPRLAVGEPYIVLQPFAKTAKNLSLAQVQDVVEVVRQVLPHWKILLVGLPEANKDLKNVDYSFLSPSLIEFLALVRHAKLLLGPRSASAHIAASYDIPAFLWLAGDHWDWYLDYWGWSRRVVGLEESREDLFQKFTSFAEELAFS